MSEAKIVYVDVDDTFVRSVGTKRVPILAVVRFVKTLKARGVQLFCRSSGGAAYARESAREFGIEECFEAFLPKPHLLLDDQPFGDWRGLQYLHPAQCDNDLESE